jgi:hypothetical protein
MTTMITMMTGCTSMMKIKKTTMLGDKIEYIAVGSIYTNFLVLKEHMKIILFSALGAEEKYDAAASHFGNIEHLLRDLSRTEHLAKKPTTRQVTLHDFFVEIQQL